MLASHSGHLRQRHHIFFKVLNRGRKGSSYVSVDTITPTEQIAIATLLPKNHSLPTSAIDVNY